MMNSYQDKGFQKYKMESERFEEDRCERELYLKYRFKKGLKKGAYITLVMVIAIIGYVIYVYQVTP